MTYIHNNTYIYSIFCTVVYLAVERQSRHRASAPKRWMWYLCRTILTFLSAAYIFTRDDRDSSPDLEKLNNCWGCGKDEILKEMEANKNFSIKPLVHFVEWHCKSIGTEMVSGNSLYWNCICDFKTLYLLYCVKNILISLLVRFKPVTG